MKEIVKYSLFVGLASLGYFLFTRMNTIILGSLGYLVGVSYYELINKVILFILMPFTIFSQVISPKKTKLFIENKTTTFNSYKKNILNSFIISTMVAIAISYIFPKILNIFLKQYFVTDVIIGMNLLLILFVFEAVMTVASVGFGTSTGHANLNMKILIIFGFLNLPISFFLARSYGFMGIIYSTLILKSISDVIFIFIYYNKLKISSKHQLL